jgi:glycosyltransferase involved in cell wall biosynthesis
VESVAILLAVYNGEKHLEALLLSLLEQDYPCIQIHVRDNCSTDGTLGILQKWQKRHSSKITLYLSERNVGVIGNFAELVKLTDEPYTMFCDCDDVWKKDKVSKTLAKMKELERSHGTQFPLLVHTDLIVVDERLNVIAPSFWNYSRLNTRDSCQLLPRLLVQNQVTGCTMLINRALKNLAAPIPSNCVMHDWWIALVAACFGKVDSLSTATLYYRQHSSNDTGAKSYSVLSFLKRKGSNVTNGKIQQVQLLLERYGEEISEQNRLTLNRYLEMQNSHVFSKLKLMFQHGFFKTGILRNFILNH